MADELVLTTQTGRVLGSRPARRLRRENKVPGVLYGLDTPPENFAVEYSELRRALTTDAGLNVIIQLEVDGERQLSILKEIQRHPYRDEVLHVDFIRVDPNAELLVDVPVVLEGEARKVTAENGMVDQMVFSLAVFASPTTIPNELTIDVSELEINDSIRVGDIELPEGVRTEVDLDEAVAIGMVTRSTMESMAEEEAAEAEAEAEAAEAAEGEPAEDDADDGGDE